MSDEEFTAESLGFADGIQAESIPEDSTPFSKRRASARQATREDVGEPDTKKLKPDTVLIIDSLRKTYWGLGVGIRVFDPVAGMQIAAAANDLAESWTTVLENDTKLRRMMKKMITGGGWSTVILAHLVVALPIMESHGVSFSHLIRRKNQESEGAELFS